MGPRPMPPLREHSPKGQLLSMVSRELAPGLRRLAAGEVFRGNIVWASQVRNEKTERLWHVSIRSRSSLDETCTDFVDMGEEQICFATLPTHLVLNKAPQPLAILHLRDKLWSSTSGNWQELDLSVSSSRQFNQECGIRYEANLRRDIRVCLSREEVSRCPSTGKAEIVKELTTVGGLRATVEFVFEAEKHAAADSERPRQRRRGESGEAPSAGRESSSWKLVDIVIMVKGPDVEG